MRLPRLTYANVVSTLCLFIVLGGGAWAATKLPKNSVGTKQLKANAVTGAKVKNGSLTGADVDAATLGKVPQAGSADAATNASHAASADTAGHATTAGTADHATSADTAAKADDATTLDGDRPGAFTPAGSLLRIAYEHHWESEGGEPRTILTAGPLTLSAVCFDSELGGTHTYLELLATGPAGSSIDYSLMLSGGAVKVGNSLLDPSTPQRVGENVYSEDPGSIHASETLVYRDSDRTISIPLGILVAGDSDVCRVNGGGTVAMAPQFEADAASN